MTHAELGRPISFSLSLSVEINSKNDIYIYVMQENKNGKFAVVSVVLDPESAYNKSTKKWMTDVAFSLVDSFLFSFDYEENEQRKYYDSKQEAIEQFLFEPG